MNLLFSFPLMAVLFFCFFSSSRANAFGDLSQRWEEEKRSPMSTVSQEARGILKDRQVLFVPGFLNELNWFHPGYFKTNMKTAEKDLDLTVSYYAPSSWRSANHNVGGIRDKILRLYEEDEMPIILFGHSKGGTEILHTILSYPELLLENKVDKVIILQAPLGGCAFVTEHQKSPVLRNLARIWGRGLENFDEQGACENFERAFAEFKLKLSQLYYGQGQEKQREISEKIYYVRSFEDRDQLSWNLWTLSKALRIDLSTSGFRNDGLINVHAQKLCLESEPKPFGIDLGVLKADHIELVSSGLFCKSSITDRQAFTRALFGQIYDPASIVLRN